MAKKIAKKAKTTKLPGFINFANKKFVMLLIIIVAVAGLGSWKLYSTSAASDGKQNFPSVNACNQFQPVVGVGVRNQRECTKTVQHFMNVIGMNAGAVDGIYGSQTTAAVNRFLWMMNTHGNGSSVIPSTWGLMALYCWQHSANNGTLWNACYQ